MTDQPDRHRTRRHWLVALPVGTALALALSVAIWSITGAGDGDGDGVDGDRTATIAGDVIGEGDERAPHALWLFGFDTLRVVPDGSVPAGRLGTRGFGSIASGSGAVFMFDPAQGRAGMLDARHTTLTEAKVSEPWAAPRPDETIAVAPDGDTAWIATAPGAVARLDRALEPRITALAPGAHDTWVAALADGAVVAAQDSRQMTLARLDTTGEARRQRIADVPTALGAPIGLDAADGTVWLVAEHGALAFDAADLTPAGAVALDVDAGPIRAHAPDGAGLWVAAEDGAAAFRLVPGRPAMRVELLSERPDEYRGQVDLAVGLGAVWALAPAGDTGMAARAATVARIDPSELRVTDTLAVPAEVFVGRIATT